MRNLVSPLPNNNNNKRLGFDQVRGSSVKKPKPEISHVASLHIRTFNSPLISKTTGFPVDSIHLQPHKPYTIGRCPNLCQFVFRDPQISKQHLQLYFDPLTKKVFVADGVFFSCSGNGSESPRVRVSLNGVFVDGVRIRKGEVKELCAGTEVLLVCGNQDICRNIGRVGFVVKRIFFAEEVGGSFVSDFAGNPVSGSSCTNKLAVANLLSSRCRQILSSDEPVFYIRQCLSSPREGRAKCVCRNRVTSNSLFRPNDFPGFLLNRESEILSPEGLANQDKDLAGKICANSYVNNTQAAVVSERNGGPVECAVSNGHLTEAANGYDNHRHTKIYMDNEVPPSDMPARNEKRGVCVPPPGKKFYLNRLHFMGQSQSGDDHNISLPELLYPIETLVRVFIATFTSDLLWFLSYCEIPAHLPVTVACHSAQRNWSSNAEERTSLPYSNFPNLVVVYPHFPDAISFGKDRKKFGIACHHPKLIVLQREDSIRIIITSANLVAKQWLKVTNTVWWQDFPRKCVPDYMSLFTQSSSEEINQDSKSDFSAQLAGFMAALLADAPCEAQWILELAKFDFNGAVGHLVASAPGIHSPKYPYLADSSHYLTGSCSRQLSTSIKLLGTAEASVVGISHLFRTSADSNGAQLKKLAAVIGKCHVNAYGMTEVILRRSLNIAADANAISVVMSNKEDYLNGDCIQLGFLPRSVAKWVAPLSDIDLFAFSAYVYPKEVLASAFEGSNNKVHLILYISQGPSFSNISKVEKPVHVSAICSLVASIQRCQGLWRLHEVLGHYKWPEHSETDFSFGSSSIGSVNAQFLAAFSAATGKRSLQFSESEESDPDWGCWSASQESRNPSVKIIFPTIERVKNSSCGILASKYILCFSQKTWLRLRSSGILHDAIPHPIDRVGHPMHVKVARRRFRSKGEMFSSGWVYCGSHNFSAAAWGRPLYNSVGIKGNGVVRSNSVLGSRLHICNYELGIVFIVPPSDRESCGNQKCADLDDIVMPFVMPAPKYRSMDRPATPNAMREALAQLSEQERQKYLEAAAVEDSMEEEMPDEEEYVLEAPDFISEEKEDEKAYAEKLWVQADSS